EGLRARFTELEFTSLLKELLPVVEITESNYTEASSEADVEAVLKAVSNGGVLAVAIEAAESPPLVEEEAESEEALLPLTSVVPPADQPARRVAISSAPGVAITVPAEPRSARARLVSALRDPDVPKAFHDFKT